MKTSTIKKKIETEYPKLVRKAESKRDFYTAIYWQGQIEILKLLLRSRFKNKRKGK